ncbi:Leucine-rich repeat-containing protein [Artemisia annua]|uniref:Leucine-rich repeat-containing protein n=1 Tax=Artemisia annua TaxID=35608 RepID=A0A2U1PM76_ARTAN|nr:Leucine-rich repeat-containing protein [Artemisia annua]
MCNSKLFFLFLLSITSASSTSFNRSKKCSKEESEALLLFKQNLSSINYTDDYFDYSCHESDYDLKLGPDVFNNLLKNFTNLEELSLGYVKINLVLPTSLNISSSLKLLNLDSTGLQGKLPHYIFNLPSLETLDLRNNSFTGNIPSKISVNQTHFTYLRLSYNRLNGTLPSWLFTSPSLESLFLNDNMFSGKVPFESFALPSLQVLDLSRNNQLAGQIDVQTFRQLKNLTDLYLSSNNFSGEWQLDTLLSSLTNLKSLDLSYNGFSVTTKNANHYVNPGFRFLELASCKLKVFPNSLRAMKQLKVLDLSSNEIHGQIPHWAGEIGGNELYRLNLSHNFITGLPQFQWYGLEQLYLQSNLIEGPFPPSICNMSNLWYLDMSNNRINGVIPKNISSSLQVLIVKSNKIEGLFPLSICNMSNLYSLDISSNSFGGVIPECVGSMMSTLYMINLGTNNFHDEEEVDESGFTWKVVTLGYGCGTLLGLVMGYLMLSTRKVKWFNAIADAAESLVLKKRRHIYIGK